VRRVMALWLPSFSTDLVRRRRRSAGADDSRRPRAVILTRAVGGREVVARACPIALGAGVRPGLDLAQARALIPPGVRLHTETHRAEREAESLHRLACWALRISPTVAPDAPDGLLLDLTGTARLYGREQRVLRSAARAVSRLGFRVRAASASTFACAAAVARHGAEPLTSVPVGAEKLALARLPVSAITDDPSTLEALHELGIESVGQVFNLPRRQLAMRFGLAILERIDRSLGHATETITPVHPPPPIRAELIFDGPTDRVESIEAAAQDVLADLVRQLSSRQRGVRRLVFTLLRPKGGGDPERITLELSRASVNGRHLWKLLQTRLERIDVGAQVEGLAAVAARTARLKHRQQADLRLGARDDEPVFQEAAGELTDTLVNRLGPERVARVVLQPSHLPERSYAVRSVMQAPPSQAAGRCAGDRPTLLIHPPEQAEVIALTPDGPVLEVGWRGAGSRRRRVAACIGPERIGAEWWRWRALPEAPGTQPPPDRDYFAVELDTGLWLWVCRQADTSRWFVHGVWA